MAPRTTETLVDLLARVVPGTALREGLERILSAHMGALIVLGDQRSVLEICTGGFHIDAEMSPQRLSELAKMDGAIVLDRSGARIAWANVHLVPDPSMPTNETGTRHRTAERVARCVPVSVISVSEEMGTITLYCGDQKRQLLPTETIANRTNQLLQTVSRFRAGFDEASLTLSEAEARDEVTLGDLALLIQRAELVRRVETELADLLSLLGDQARLARPELSDLVAGVADEQVAALRAFLDNDEAVTAVRESLEVLPIEEVRSLDAVVALLGGRALGAGASISLRHRQRGRLRAVSAGQRPERSAPRR
jgi:diadenylate cyclase